MIRLFNNANYDFIGLRRVAYAITAAIVIPGILWLLFTGLNYSIEFTGGTLVQVRMHGTVTAGDLRTAVENGGMVGAEIQNFGTAQEFVIRARLTETGTSGEDQAQATETVIRQALTTAFGDSSFTVDRREAVGPKVGGELRQKALIAVLLSFMATLVYLAFRFEFRFGVAAVVATAHDILATMAFIKYMDLEMSLVVVSAILTVVGYSLNDTIIIFDRARENLRKYKRDDLAGILNRSINETLPRSVLTHGTTLAALMALLVFGGEVIRPFAWVMAFGVFTGTFSSIYIAAPILMIIETRWPGKDTRGAKVKVAVARPDAPAAI